MRRPAILALCLALALLAADVAEARQGRQLMVPGNGKGKGGPGGKGKGQGSPCGAVPGGAPGTCAACAGNSKKCKKCNMAPDGRGFFPSSKSGCIGCKDVNCHNCGNGGQCKVCVPGYALKGNKCILCDAPGMTISKGRCKCPVGQTFNRDNTACVPDTTDDN